MKGRSCSAATPATRACVPSPPATPSRSAPPRTACRASSATSCRRSGSSTTTSAPRARARSARWNFSTFPPPERGFMIRNGCRARPTDRSGMPGAVSSTRAALPAETATAHRASETSTTHSSPAVAYRIRTPSGAATTRIAASPLIQPVWVSIHHPPAAVSTSPAHPTPMSTTLPSPAKTTSTTSAAVPAARATRAVQRLLMGQPPTASPTAGQPAGIPFRVGALTPRSTFRRPAPRADARPAARRHNGPYLLFPCSWQIGAIHGGPQVRAEALSVTPGSR